MILCNARTVTNICACYNGVLADSLLGEGKLFFSYSYSEWLPNFLNTSLKLALNNISTNFLREHLNMREHQSIGF